MVVILMGVSGSGKTFIGERLAAELDWSFYEGDDYHPQSNVEKMSQGVALTDADRAPWLDALHVLIGKLLAQDESAILTCSALKRVYRDQLVGDYDGGRIVYLRGSYTLIRQRLESRKGHFMKADLLASQFRALEEPEANENVLTVDISQRPKTIVETIKRELTS
jgi:carbohydrate kinase (thermoresistant glucokinase family)